MSVGAVVLIVATIVIIILVTVCLKRKAETSIKHVDTAVNAAYGVTQTEVDLSTNVSYVANDAASIEAHPYEYVDTDPGAIATSVNEAYEHSGSVPLFRNQAYGLVKH